MTDVCLPGRTFAGEALLRNCILGTGSYPCRKGGYPSPRQSRLWGLQLSCGGKGPLLRLGNMQSGK